MKRIAFAGMIALLVCSSLQAQNFGPGCNYGAGGYGAGAGTAWAADGLGFINKRPSPFGLAPFGFLGLGFRMYAGIHQHGPLVNYGPYEGYYPFEPYGPWNRNIEYTGPMVAPTRIPVWTANTGLYRPLRERNALLGQSSGRYALQTFHNVGSRLNPLRHRTGQCSADGGILGMTGGTSTTGMDLASGMEPGLPSAPVDAVRMVGLSVRER